MPVVEIGDPNLAVTQPTRKQQPPQKRAPAKPLPSRPANALLKLGYTGDIHSFNNRVQNIVESHQTEFGYWPSPAVVLDIARANVDDNLIPHLFDGHSTPELYGSLNKDRRNNPHDYTHARPDGLQQVYSPFMRGERHAPPAEPEAHKQFPMIPDGYLPVPGFHSLVGAIQQIDRAGAAQGKAQAGAQQAGAHGGPLTEMYRERALMAGADVKQGTTTVGGAQKHLREIAPEFFGELPADGHVNVDWAKAINRYQHSQRYARDSLKQLASDNNLSVSNYMRAWNSKTEFIKTHALLAHVAQSIPITLWAHRGGSVTGQSSDLWRYENIGLHGADYVTAPLNWAVQTGKLAFNLSGGTFGQLMSDTGAMNAYLGEIMPKWVGGSNATHAEAVKFATEVARKNPTILNTFLPRVAAHLEGSKTLGYKGNEAAREVDQFVTFAGLILSAHPRINGVRVASGDTIGLKSNAYFDTATRFAYNSVRKGEPLGIAAKQLEGSGGEALVVAAKENPDMSLSEFRQRAANIYHGRDEIKAPIFRSLRSAGLPTPKTGKEIRSAVGGIARDIEDGLFRSGYRGTDNATSFAGRLVGEFRRAVPRETTFFNPTGERAAEDVYNWAQKNGLGARRAHELRDEFITLRPKEDVSGLSSFTDKLFEINRDTHGEGEKLAAKGEPFTPIIESDLPFTLHFPAPEVLGRARRVNATLNKIAARHRQIIMVGPFQLATFAKHAVADTLRRTAADVSQLFGLSADGKAAKTELQTLLGRDAESRRTYGQARAAGVQSEAKWLIGATKTDRQTFNLGELRGAGQLSKAHLEAAGAYLRRHLNDEALSAYLRSTVDNLEPLKGYVLGNKAVREGILLNREEYSQSVREMNERLGGQLNLSGELGREAEAGEARQALARDHAAIIYHRYQEIDESLRNAGLTLEDASALAAKKDADKQLTAMLHDNNVDLPVHAAEVNVESKWDAFARWWIGDVVMRPNKWNRGKLFDYVLHETLGDMTRGGWNIKDALPAASDVALRQTVYHMLDFSNMLQVERDLRYVSYFATKHRLYWTWIAKYFIKHPGVSLALQQANDKLNLKNGNLNFTLGGKAWYIPVGRLLWVNSREYPQTSPVFDSVSMFGKNISKGWQPAFGSMLSGVTATSGNVVTRDDQLFLSLYRLARAETGTGYTFDGATSGMSPVQKRGFADSMVEFAIGYQAEHGHLPTEQEATKAALFHASWSEALRANVPIVLNREGTPQDIRKLQDAYGKLTDPAARSKFLEANPELSAWFGHTKPDLWWHSQPLWAKFNTIRRKLNEAKRALFAEARQTDGSYRITPDLLRQMKKIGAQWHQALTELRAEDANGWGGNGDYPAGKAEKVNGVWNFTTDGPWWKQFAGDPFAARAFLHEAFPKIPFGKLNAETTNAATVELQRVKDLLVQPGGGKQFGLNDQDKKTLLVDINGQLDTLRSYPKDAEAKAQDSYYTKYLIPYIKQREAKRAEAVPSENQDLYDQNFRLWRQQHDHPVKITAGGKSYVFPSVVTYGYAMAPKQVRQGWINSFAHDDPLNLAPYELKMLYGDGMTLGKQLADAQTLYTNWVNQINKQLPPVRITKEYRMTLAKAVQREYPDSGFYNLYLWSLQPKVKRFEISQPYKLMDATVRRQYDTYLGTPAKQYAAAIAANHNADYYKKYWRHYIDSPYFQGVLRENPALKAEIDKFGVNFPYTLVGS